MKMNTDEHTKDLLSQHEHEIARLKAEVRLKMPLLMSIRKYIEICKEEKELERIVSYQTRILGRGRGRDPGILLREEMRKRVEKEKPNLCQFLFLLSCPSAKYASHSSNNSYFHHCPHGRQRTDGHSSCMAKACCSCLWRMYHRMRRRIEGEHPLPSTLCGRSTRGLHKA